MLHGVATPKIEFTVAANAFTYAGDKNREISASLVRTEGGTACLTLPLMYLPPFRSSLLLPLPLSLCPKACLIALPVSLVVVVFVVVSLSFFGCQSCVACIFNFELEFLGSLVYDSSLSEILIHFLSVFSFLFRVFVALLSLVLGSLCVFCVTLWQFIRIALTFWTRASFFSSDLVFSFNWIENWALCNFLWLSHASFAFTISSAFFLLPRVHLQFFLRQRPRDALKCGRRISHYQFEWIVKTILHSDWRYNKLYPVLLHRNRYIRL